MQLALVDVLREVSLKVRLVFLVCGLANDDLCTTIWQHVYCGLLVHLNLNTVTQALQSLRRGVQALTH